MPKAHFVAGTVSTVAEISGQDGWGQSQLIKIDLLAHWCYPMAAATRKFTNDIGVIVYVRHGGRWRPLVGYSAHWDLLMAGERLQRRAKQAAKMSQARRALANADWSRVTIDHPRELGLRYLVHPDDMLSPRR